MKPRANSFKYVIAARKMHARLEKIVQDSSMHAKVFVMKGDEITAQAIADDNHDIYH